MLRRWLATLPLRFRAIFHAGVVEQELQDELQAHVEQLTAQLVARGATPLDARRDALRAMGGVERRKEEMRSVRRTHPLESVLRDVRHALRALARRPGFAAIIIVTLAIGTGANVAIFTMVNAVLLRPLHYGDPDRLVVIDHQSGDNAVPAELYRWKRAAPKSLDRIGAAVFHTATLTGRGVPDQVNTLYVTSDIFPMMQVAPLLGRVFTADEDHDGHDAEAVLSYDYWQRRFGGDRTILGQRLVLDGKSRTVIGVMPRDFRFAPYWATNSNIWIPLSFDGQENDWDMAALRVFARLRTGATLEQARSEVRLLGAALSRERPGENRALVVVPLKDKVIRAVRDELWILLAAVLIVLLIACANVSHLQLIRAAARERESAVRLTLGATRGRLVQQALIESLVLAAAGALAGLALGAVALRGLLAVAPPDLPRLDSVHLDGVVFAFLIVVVMGTGLLSGVLPAFTISDVDPNRVLKAGGRGGETARRRRIAQVLVASEFALAVLLLIGAGLVLRSVAGMLAVDTVFDPRDVTTMQVALRGTQHASGAQRGAFYTTLLQQVSATPSVVAAGAINHLPLHGDTWRFSFWTAEHPLAKPNEKPHAYFRLVTPGYFRAMKIPVMQGRDIVAADNASDAHVVVIDQSLASTNWPGENPIGKRISVDDPGANQWFTVVGVVRDVHQPDWSDRHVAEMYYPYWNTPFAGDNRSFNSLLSQQTMTLVIRTAAAGTVTPDAVRRIAGAIDADAPIADVISMDDAVSEQVAEPRFYLTLLGLFSVVALVLAAVGVYGVMSNVINSRTREIGIRMALGASRSTPFRLALHQGLRIAATGAAAGVVVALVLSRYLQTLLYRVAPTDPVTFITVPVILLSVAAVACVFPARRAARIDPVIALREE